MRKEEKKGGGGGARESKVRKVLDGKTRMIRIAREEKSDREQM